MTPHFSDVVVVLLLVYSLIFFSVLSECVFLSEYSISLGNEVMCLELGAWYECRSSCGVQQKGSYPLNPRVSAQRDGLLGAGEKLIMLLLSPPGPLLIFFLYKCWQRESWILISPPCQPPSSVFLSIVIRQFQITHIFLPSQTLLNSHWVFFFFSFLINRYFLVSNFLGG